jgi:hypothetical protein
MPPFNGRGEPANTLWVFPLIAGLVPFAATAATLWLYIALTDGHSCNPLIEGCVSISRTAKHGLPNHLFRILVLPAAALQAQTWLLCGPWLKGLGAESRRTLRVLPWLGVVGAAFLVLYGGLLGTEGAAYRWMRHYGVLIYFGATYLCMAITALEFWRLTRSRLVTAPARLDRWLLGICLVIFGMWLAQTFLRPFIEDKDLKNRLTNILEWYAEIGFTVFFLGLAWVWRSLRFTVQLVSNGARQPLS